MNERNDNRPRSMSDRSRCIAEVTNRFEVSALNEWMWAATVAPSDGAE